MRVRFIAGSPDVQAQQQLVSQLQKAISGMITNDLSQARDRLNTLNGLIAQFQNKVSTMPAQTREVVKLTRASDVLGQLYVLLMQKQQEAELSQEATVSSTRVLTTAQLPLTSSRPAAAIILAFSFVLGLLAACIFALVRGEMTDTLESENDLRRRSPALVFGVIPRFRPAAAFFDPAAAPASVVESFRRLRINLNNILGAEKSRTILLNSAGGGENTKVVAVTLAKSLADDGKNVVLLDADLRRGGLSEYLGLQSARGLSEWLVSGEQSSVQRLVGQRFAVLPAGQSPSHPADLLSSPNLSIILKGILSTCDFVIIDSSPFPAVSDAATLAKQADLVISVIEVGVSSKRLVDVHQSAIVPLAQQYGLIIANAAAPRRADTYAYPQDLKTSPAPAPGENRPASEPGGRWAPAKG
jgi:Mrp family chromosome partitioning ATPase